MVHLLNVLAYTIIYTRLWQITALDNVDSVSYHKTKLEKFIE